MFEDMLRDTWAYREIMEEGLQQGLRQGLQQGLQQGELKASRAMLIHLVQKRFPELALLAEQRANLINEPSVLQTMVDMLIDVQTAVEVRRILMGEIGQA